MIFLAPTCTTLVIYWGSSHWSDGQYSTCCVCVGVIPSAFWPAEVQRKLETFIIETLYVFINEYLYRNTQLLRDKENPLYTGVPYIHQFTPFTKITLNLKLSAAQYRLLMFMECQINIYSNRCTYLQIIKDRYKISSIQLEISPIDLKISSNELYLSTNKHNWRYL